jgi:hypothetical protein
MARKLKTAKNSKLPKLPENCFEPVGKGGWPLISTWINTPSLGRNGIHCIEFPGERENHLLNVHLDELLALLENVALWKVVMNLLLAGLNLFNQLGYMRCLGAEGIFCFVAFFSTYFCWIEGAWAEALVVAISLCSPFEQIVKKLNFVV